MALVSPYRRILLLAVQAHLATEASTEAGEGYRTQNVFAPGFAQTSPSKPDPSSSRTISRGSREPSSSGIASLIGVPGVTMFGW
jgi:hypothetical protein